MRTGFAVSCMTGHRYKTEGEDEGGKGTEPTKWNVDGQRRKECEGRKHFG